LLFILNAACLTEK